MDGQKNWKVVSAAGVPVGNVYVPCLFIEYLDESGTPQPTVFLLEDRGGYRRLEDARRAALAARIENVDAHGGVTLKPQTRPA